MPLHQETTYHDRQCESSLVPQLTSSLVFVDITSAELTTTDLSQPASYLIFFSVLIQASLNNTVASFQLLADGLPISMQPSTLILKTKEQDVGFTFLGCFDAGSGVILQPQMKTDKGVISLQENALTIDGVPVSRVIT